MAALLKDVYNRNYISHLADVVEQSYPALPKRQFIEAVFNEEWADKELKARTLHLAQQLNLFIDLDYLQTLTVIKQIAPHFTGYEGMFIPAFVECYGLQEFSASINALSYITQFASAEFAVRPFIVQYPQQMQTTLLTWCNSDDLHIRRLASEGCRPRLPWAMALPEFKKDPSFILPILDALKNDDSEYVRRSVANNLNDIAKDHPLIVVNLAQQWLTESKTKETKRLVKHACRSLLKQANPSVLSLFGFLPPKYIEVVDFTADKAVSMGDVFTFSCHLIHQKSLPLNKLRIEFAIDFMKKNGQQARKIFQLSEAVINKDNKRINKAFSFKNISTRQYYSGQHSVAILVNGVQLADIDFILED